LGCKKRYRPAEQLSVRIVLLQKGRGKRSGKKRLRSVDLTGRQNLLAAPFCCNARDVPKLRRHFFTAATALP